MSDVNTRHFPHGDILVVDDTRSDLKLLSGILRKAGYTVRPASDGELALRSVRARLPALILLDVGMPGLDGYEVCRRLKDAKDTRDIPVIFISVKTSPLDKVKAFGVGGVDYISKPFEPEEVLARVATHLALWKEQKEVEEKNLQLQQEIAERKRAEERTEHLNLVLRAIRSVNQLITREKDRGRLLQGACESLIETRGYHNAWIALLDEAGGLETSAEAGLGEDFSALVEQLQRGELTACGRDALVQQDVVVVKDPLSTCADCPLAAKYGGRGAMTVRLERAGKVYGLLTVSIPADFVVDGEEQALFREVAGDIAFALYSIELEEKRKRAEETLRESEEKFRTLVEGAGAGFYVAAPNGDALYISDYVEDIIKGYKPSDWYKKGAWASLIHPDDKTHTIKEWTEGIKSKKPYVVEYRFVCKDGTPVWVADHAYPKYVKGKVDKVEGFILDITERKRAEEALRESRDAYRATVETTGTAMLIGEEDTTISMINTEFEKLCGYSKEEVEGKKSWVEFIVKADLERMKGYHNLRMTDPDVAPPYYEFQFIDKQGNVKDALITLALIPGTKKTVGSLLDITERKRAEEALRESEGRYRNLFETMEQGVVYQDADTTITSANPAAERILGLTLDQMQGRTTHDSLWRTVQEDGSDFPGEDHPVSVALRTGKPVRDVVAGVFHPETEETRWINVNAMPQFKPGEKKPYQVYATFSDITERKQAEEALRVSEERFALAVQGSNDGIWDWDIQNNSLYWSPRLKAFLGYADDELEIDFETFESLLHPDDREHTGAAIEAHLKDRGLYDMEQRLRTKSGQYCWFRARGQALWDEAGNPVRMVGSTTDITERKRMEEALRESEEKYRTILENIEDGYYEVDLDGNLTFFNDSLREMLGYPPRELLGLNNQEFMDDETARSVYQTFDEVYRTGKPAKVVGWALIRKDGDRRLVETSVSLISDPTGKPIGFQGVARDVTERKRAEERMRRQEQLAAVGQLAGGIAHDFNNLLTTIMLYAEIPLGKRDLLPNLARSFETILGESRKAAELVQQILDFSRRATIKVQPLDLKPFTGEVIDMLRRMIPEHIHLLLEVGAEEYVVEADPTRIQQVLMNLATNARDAMPGGGELRFELSRVQLTPGEEPPVAGMPPLSSPPQAGGIEGGEWVCLAVSDTGAGMTEEVRAHLFEPFFTTKEVGKGTGLGLAQVYGIVGQHEGYIGVETEVGKGTTFRIYLPASRAGEEITEEITATPRGKGETILLVEDNEKLREGGRGLLESLGYRALAAADGRKALEVYQTAEEVDLVVTDLVMPEMGGQQLVHELRQATPGLKALAITGYVMREDGDRSGRLEQLKEEGFLDVVHKPFDVDALARAVRRALDED